MNFAVAPLPLTRLYVQGSIRTVRHSIMRTDVSFPPQNRSSHCVHNRVNSSPTDALYPLENLILAQTLPHTLPTPLPIFRTRASPLFTQQLCGLGIRRALVIGACKQADDAQQNGFWGLHGAPPLSCALVAVLVVFGRVQDGDAEQAVVRIDVGVEGDRVEECEGGRS